MARKNVFALDPVEYELERQEAQRQGRGIFEEKKPKAPAPALKPDGSPDYGRIATDTQVPRNLIIALTDAAGLKNGAQKGAFATEAASRIGQEMAAGKDARAALASILGEDAPVDDLIKAAKAVPEYDRIGTEGDEAAQADPTESGSALGDAGKQFAGGVAKGSGASVEGFGLLRTSRLYDPLNLINDEGKERVGEATRSVADAMREWGEETQAGVSPQSLEAIKGSTPDGDLFKPSTWSLGEKPSLRGYAMLTMDVLGSLAPVVVSSVIGTPGAGAAVGGMQSGGAGAEMAREIVQSAAKERVEGPDGEMISRLEADSSYYRDLREQGESHEVAVQKTTEAAERLAALYAAPIGALGGAFTGTLVTGGMRGLAGRSAATRVGGGAALGAAEESAQEVAEGMAAKAGAGQAAGMDVDVTEGTFGDAILGALGGGPVGAVGGIATEGPATRDEDDETPPPAQLPPPDTPPLPSPEPTGPIGRAAQKAPGMLTGDFEEGTRITVQGQGSNPFEAEFVEETPNGVRLRDETGPILIPRQDIESGAVQIGQAERRTPTGMFPDMKPGAEVALRDADGRDYTGVFLREDEGGVAVRIAGQEITLSPQEFDEARDAAQRDETDAPKEAEAQDQGADEAGAAIEIPEGVDPGEVEQIASDLINEQDMDRPSAEAQAIQTIQQRMEEERAAEEQAAIPGAQDMAEQGEVTPPDEGQAQGEVAPVEPQPPASVEGVDPDLDTPQSPELQAEWWKSLPRLRKAAKDIGMTKEALADEWSDKGALTAAVDAELGRLGDTAQQSGLSQNPAQEPENVDDIDVDALIGQNLDEMDAEDAALVGDESNTSGVVEQEQGEGEPQTDEADPAADIEQAAQETEENPTPAQAEAENYKTGKAEWQGRTLSIENRKGSMRRKVGPDGETAWEVEMPAHYGRILKTEGADGDHVDFYMGDNPASESVWVIDQMDADTGRYDEHKVMLGFDNANAAAETYMDGFSDGKGPDRLGGMRKMSVTGFNEWLEGDTTAPVTPMAKRQDKDAAQAGDDTNPKGPRVVVNEVGADGLTESERAAGKAPLDLVTVTDVYGDTHRVSKRTLDSDRPMLRRFNANGEEIDGSLLSRDNIDTDGTGVTATFADSPVIGGGRTADKPLASEAAIKRAIRKRGQKVEDFDIQEVNGGYLGVRKTGSEAAEAEAAGWTEDATPPDEPQPREAESVDVRTLPGKHGKVDTNLVKINMRKWPEGYDVTGSYDIPGFAGGTLSTPYRQFYPTKHEAAAAALKMSVGRNTFPDEPRAPFPTQKHVSDGRKIRQFLEELATPEAWAAEVEAESPSVSIEQDAENRSTSTGDAPAETVEDIDVDALISENLDQMEAEDAAESEASTSDEQRITDSFLEAFRAGERFARITQARKRAGEALGRDIEVSDFTMLEEAIEAAVVMRAREIVAGESDPVTVYADLLDLYDAQPILSERTPEKMRNQAYSTPAPLAYVASRLVGIGDRTRVVEPSAGNGMLLIEAAPENVQANELQPHRAAQLERIFPGSVSQGDAMDMTAAPFDVLITNPPFGRVMNEDTRQKKEWAFGDTGVKTKEIDHAMAYRYLEQMPDDGRAVLIVGSVKKTGDRKKNYQERSKLTFYKTLFDHYNVTEHFTVNGDLYKRQGAAWPVDVIVIDGRAPSARAYPMAEPPEVLSTWAEIGRKLNDAPDVDTTGRGPGDAVGGGAEGDGPDGGAVSPTGDAAGQPDAGRSDRPSGSRGTGGLSVEPGRGARGDTGGDGEPVGGNGQPAVEPDAAPDVSGEEGRPETGTDGASEPVGVSERHREPGGVGPRTAGQAAQEGVQKTGDAVKDAGAAIKAILNAKIDPNKTGAMGAGFLQDVYEQIEPHLKSAWDNVTGAAKDFKEAVGLFLRAVREQMGLTTAELRNLQPYLAKFVEDAKAAWGKPKSERGPARENTEAETDFQVAYQPRSSAQFRIGSLVPRAMEQAAQEALDKIEAKHGPVDKYVASELGYDLDDMLGTPEKKGYFAAEQVDALALAINNVSQGKGFIIGDQTGIGKGRFVAAMLRHAEKQGKIPIFVTEKPGLYADMVRDLRDIGMADAQDGIIATNNTLDAIPITGPDDTFTRAAPKERKALFNALMSGKLPEGKRFVFTTYDQMQTAQGKWPERANAIRAAAPNAVIIMDESHNAGGSAGASRNVREPGAMPENRAEFFRDLVDMSAGSVFSSATYAKNPTVMSLYRSTNLSLALPEGSRMDDLGPAIERGGVPLQQVIANAIAGDGQYLRREKSFAGIDFNFTHELGDDNPIKVDRDMAINVSQVMGEIAMFDSEVMSGVRESFIAQIQGEGLMAGNDGFVGPDSISKTSDNPFASSFHNLVSQFLLGVKVNEVADMAINKWKAGEKPILGVMNVNSSVINEYMAVNGIHEDGQEVDLNFTTIVDRYLERLRRIKIEKSDNTQFYYTMTDADMGDAAAAEMRRVRDLIYSLPIEDMPGSPVDAMLDRMRAAGMKVDEITGRSTVIEDGRRATRSPGQGENKRRMNEYNSGALDGLVISSSGATGFSMHATDAPNNDGKKRHMIIAQPHADINVFMQMLGRINRTGQTVLPEYTLAVSNLSLERRVAAILSKKMASLNANTTAAKRGATSLGDGADFINEVGDHVVRRYLADNNDLAIRTGLVEGDADGDQNGKIEGIAKKLTGRFAFLHPDEVDRHYEAIGSAFRDYMAQLEVEGSNPLEAKTLDLEAKTISSFVLSEGHGTDSLLDADLTLEKIDAKKPGKPYTAQRVDELVNEGLDGKTPDAWLKDAQDALDAKMPAYQTKLEEDKADREKRLAAAQDTARQAEAAIPRLEESLEKAKVARDEVNAADDDARKAAADAVKKADKALSQARRHVTKTKRDVEKAAALIEDVENRMKRQEQAVASIKTALEGVVPGATYRITTPSFDTPAVVIETDLSQQGANPTAAGAIRVRFAVADNMREIAFSLNQIMNQSAEANITPDPNLNWKPAFTAGQSVSREQRWMATGNLIAGVDRFKNSTGQIVIYTTADGRQRTGLLMPKKFDPAQELDKEDVRFPDTATAAAFLQQYDAVLKTADKNVSFQQDGADFKLRVGKARGRAFFLLKAVQSYIRDFRDTGKGYVGRINRGDLKTVLDIYADNLGVSYVADNFKDAAREVSGQETPDFEAGAGSEVKAARGRRAGAGSTTFTEEGARQLRNDLEAELSRFVKSGRIKLRLAGGFTYGGFTLDGFFYDNVIGVGAKAPEGPMGILRHEIIHALRSKELWGRDYGLFTKDEWRTLAKAARRIPHIRERVEREYADLNTAGQTEEMIAEMFREWMQERETRSEAGKALDKLRRIIEAIANALRRNGANEAAQVMERIRSGEVGGRGPDGPGGPGAGGVKASRRRSDPSSPRGVPHPKPRQWRKKGGDLWRDFLSDAMGGGPLGKYNLLALVPGRPLFEELGRNLPGAQTYLRLKEKMDAMRQEWHAKTDTVAREWIKLGNQNTEANGRLMDLMHRATLAGVDPSRDFDRGKYDDDFADQRYMTWLNLRREFEALPRDYQRMFRKVRNEYSNMADEFEKAVIENIQTAQKVALKRAQKAHDKEMRRITDEGLTGQEKQDAIDEAKHMLGQAKARMGWAQNARVAELRAQFESNRLSGPYFPLARFGKYFVAARDEKGRVVSFSRFEKQRQQRDEAKRMEAEGYEVERGVLGESDADLKKMVDPSFVADIENLLGTWDVDPAVMDTVWQKWLETLPDQSIRTSRIHRKGQSGFSKDALRAFTHHMFHGAHQLARLKYGLQMEDAVSDAYDEAALSRDANRATLVVDEMNRRHQYTMQPNVAPWASGITSLAFVWYLGATPAAAMVNMTQTTVMGVPLMRAAFQGTSIGEIGKQLGKASMDFVQGRGSADNSPRLTEDEKAALDEAYRRGTIDKTQAHELASVAETGIEYSGTREKIMRFFSYMFHKAEVFNREVTFLASYRLARDKGLMQEKAIDRAASLTWKIHFDYQGSSRARFMQPDFARVLLIFRQHSVNLLYRLFRDTQQTFEGKTEADRREAKAQLVGITLSMMAHAGITGTWGYGLITMLLSMFFPGDDDDIDEWLHDALLLEGNGMGTAAWNYTMGMALKGVPGHVTGVALSERIGMPNLWFRGPFYDMEAADTLQHYVHEALGPAASILFSMGRGIQQVSEGNVWRGAESMVPKMANDLSQGFRYGLNGVQNSNGDPILEDVSPYQAIVQAVGFTPAQLAERYDDMSRMRDMERQIEQERSSLHREAGDAVMDGKGLPRHVLKKIRAFNKAHPTFPITGDTLRRSMKSRKRWSEGVAGGININPRLRSQIEEGMAPRLYE
ncbi:PLxRFG domain-containing protein [Roseovarius nitratireducens]|uniref:PLxRFG domain-containing protein n=1 Tax=Roseovarius nitratireducens TaxID=2044597 RepID=UPI000CE24760|nr:PLxRFG domain-containing protein [Roseovarius nitratireducens]